MRKLLLVTLSESAAVLPAATHRLLAQRLILKAIADTRAVDIAFWDCPGLAQSFGAESGSGHPDLADYQALAVLGAASWLEVEASPWTEILTPTVSLTAYELTRATPVVSEIATLVIAGFSANVATKLVDKAGSLQALKDEAERVNKALTDGAKITKASHIFKRVKDVSLALAAQAPDKQPVTVSPVLEILS